MPDLQQETIEVLQALVRFNTVNPPGNERPAIEYLAEYARGAGFEPSWVELHLEFVENEKLLWDAVDRVAEGGAKR